MFFKKLRMKLIKGEGIRKYLIYALGEIILIVTGVLLAIQVNNWNEARKNNNLKKRHYQSLISDFRADLAQLNSSKERFAGELEQIKSYEMRLNSDKTNLDTLLIIVRKEFNPSIPPFVRFNTTTLETLKSTGGIGLLDNSILDEISALRDLQNEQQYYQEASLQAYNRLLEKYLLGHTIHMGFINKGPLEELVWKDISPSDLILNFNALLTIKKSALGSAVNYYNRIVPKTENLIELIRTN